VVRAPAAGPLRPRVDVGARRLGGPPTIDRPSSRSSRRLRTSQSHSPRPATGEGKDNADRRTAAPLTVPECHLLRRAEAAQAIEDGATLMACLTQTGPAFTCPTAPSSKNATPSSPPAAPTGRSALSPGSTSTTPRSWTCPTPPPEQQVTPRTVRWVVRDSARLTRDTLRDRPSRVLQHLPALDTGEAFSRSQRRGAPGPTTGVRCR
jgi:hypothetical protein